MTTEKRKAKRGEFRTQEDKKKKKKIYKYKSKDKRFTDKQASMHMDIKEKSHSQYPKKFKADKHGRFRGKVYDAPPTTLVKAGVTGKHGKIGLPIHGISKTSSSKKGLIDFKVKPYSGSVKTGFTGYDTKTPSKGLKKGGRAGFRGGGRTNLLEELGRVEAEPSNRNRRAEISRVHGELNRGYKHGKRVKKQHGGSAQSHYVQHGYGPHRSSGKVLKGKKVGIQIK
jgi:hypothetical protein